MDIDYKQLARERNRLREELAAAREENADLNGLLMRADDRVSTLEHQIDALEQVLTDAPPV
jgi:chromosome segregation ATPase